MDRIPREKNRIIESLKEKVLDCPKCGSRTLECKDRLYTVRCSWSRCKARTSFFTESIFSKARVDIEIFLKVLDYWLLKMKVGMISRLLLISRNAVKRIISVSFKKAVPEYYQKLPKIGGIDKIVEVDESKFGKRKYNRGRRVEGVWVLGFYERKGPIILLPVETRDALTLKRHLKKYIDSDSKVYSDCWRGYIWCREYFNEHFTVNHSREFVNRETNCHTNGIEGSWSAIKATIPKQSRTKVRIMPYLVRYMLLKNESGDTLHNLVSYLLYFFFFFAASRKEIKILGAIFPLLFFYSGFGPNNGPDTYLDYC